MRINSFAFLSMAASLSAVVSAGPTPLRVDINSEGRSDMRTVGWENWRPSGDDMRHSSGGVTVTLRSGSDGGSIILRGTKALVVHGVTLGADGAVAKGGVPAAMEVQIEGLAPGPHTFVGYHHALGGGAGSYTVSTGNRKTEGFEPSREPRHNDDVGTSFIEFEAKAGEPVVIRIAATNGDVGSFHHSLLAHNAGRNWSLAGALDQANRIQETRTGTTTYKGSKSGLPGLPDSQEDVGGWEEYSEIRRPAGWDTDSDGMPDTWERRKGLDPDDTADGALEPDGDGDTNLEDYLNWLAAGYALR